MKLIHNSYIEFDNITIDITQEMRNDITLSNLTDEVKKIGYLIVMNINNMTHKTRNRPHYIICRGGLAFSIVKLCESSINLKIPLVYIGNCIESELKIIYEPNDLSYTFEGEEKLAYDYTVPEKKEILVEKHIPMKNKSEVFGGFNEDVEMKTMMLKMEKNKKPGLVCIINFNIIKN